MAKKSRFFLGTVIGTALGGVLGVLFARKSGKRLREEISQKAKEGIMPLKTLGREILEVKKEAWGELVTWFQSPEVQKVIAKGKLKLDEIIAEIENYAKKHNSEQVKKVLSVLHDYAQGVQKKTVKEVKKLGREVKREGKKIGKLAVKKGKKIVKAVTKKVASLQPKEQKIEK